MLAEQYRNELDRITATAQFKERLTGRLYDESQKDRTQKFRFPFLQRKALPACAAVIGICLLIVLYSNFYHSGQPSLPVSEPSSNTIHSTTNSSSTSSTANSDRLPLLTMPPSIFGEGQGSGSIAAYDVRELLETGNPWTKDAGISALPVFKNPYTVDWSGAITAYNIPDHELTDTLYRLADVFHFKRAEIRDMSYYLYIDNDDDMVRAFKDGGYGLLCSSEKRDSIFENSEIVNKPTREGYKKAIEQFMQEYPSVFPYEKPVCGSWNTYDYDGKKIWEFSVHDSKGSLEEQIVSYNFNNTIFHIDEDNKLSGFDRYQSDSFESVGDYPIIPLEKARELLLAGKYYSQTFDKPSDKYVKAVVLGYVKWYTLNYYMPYYQFYIEQTDDIVPIGLKGIKNYGVYYVPAVPSQYFTNYDSLNFKFNQ